LQKVEEELEQGLKRVWSMESDLRGLAETLSASGVTAAALPSLKEELRQVRDHLGRAQDRQTDLATRVEEMGRQGQVEAGRERQELAAVTMQLEALAKEVAQYESHLRAQEDASRHVKDDVAGTRLAHEGLARDLQEMSTVAARALEGSTRLGHELSRANGQIEALRGEGEALSERLTLMQDQFRRQGERLGQFEAAVDFLEKARELLQRASFERGQMAERLAAIDRVSEELLERVQEFTQGLARLDQRSQSQATQLLLVTEQLRELDDQTKGQIKRLFQATLRQRRRQVEALAQEIKELSQGEIISEE
jgi:chromosome segregation ATPase